MHRVSRRRTAALLVAAASLIAVPSIATAGAPTGDDPIATWNAWLAEQSNDVRRNRGKMQEKAAELLAGVDFSAMSLDRLVEFRTLIRYEQDATKAFNERIDAIAGQTDRDGARAAMYAAGATAGRLPMEERVERARRVFAHPSRNAALDTIEAGEFVRSLGGMDPAIAREMADEILSLRIMFELDVAPDKAMVFSAYTRSLKAMGDAIPADDFEAVRSAAARRLGDALVTMKAEAGSEVDESMTRMLDRMERERRVVEGAFMRGKLLDHPAPAVDFTWYSGGQPVKNLADLKGKVVVVDFWATWCGPCISSFPKVRELQAHYEGYDVVVLGVTSLQGRHYPGDGPAVDTTGDPDKEYALMETFMESKEITWPVAFSTDDVFNPEFGVRGIPHVAIIDAEGVVRHRGLHPAGQSLAEKAEMIDVLLAEAGLATPAPVGSSD